MIFDNPLLRGMLTAMFWIRKPEYPTRVYATPEEGLTWADTRIKPGLRSGD